MRNVPLSINQTFFLNNQQESELTDEQVTALVVQELTKRPMKVKRLERDSTGCVKHIQLDLG
jgi:hypothetical protein